MTYRDLAGAAIAMIDANPELSLDDIADRIGITPPTIRKYWKQARPGIDMRGSGSARAKQFAALCDEVYAALTLPSTLAGLRGTFPRVHERTLLRAMARLIESGRVVRTGARAHATYERKAP